MDVNRQAWAGATTLLVHPADLYVGLRSERYVRRARHAAEDRSDRHRPGRQPGRGPPDRGARRPPGMEIPRTASGARKKSMSRPAAMGSTLEPVTCTFETPVGGSYRITALVSDDQGRQNQSQITRWVSGGQQPPSRKVEQEAVTLIPDQETYQPGDVAHILVQAPFSPAEGLLTVSRSGILYTAALPASQDGSDHPGSAHRGRAYPQPEHPGGSGRRRAAQRRPGRDRSPVRRRARLMPPGSST